MFAEVADENQTNTSGLNASELLLEKDTGGINAALMYAASADHTNAMKLLLDEGADINVKDKYGDTLLIQAVSAGHTDVVKFLLDKGAGDINAALMKAVVSGDTNVVELLLARKADINTLDTDGSTALGIAQRMGNAAIAQLLRQAGATALSASDSSFNVAVASGTNTDSSGYVTNEALLTPFTLTNSVGDVITNAVLVKLTANKFVYKTDTGAMGMLPLASLPEDLRKKFGYAPQAAQAADEAEQAKKVQGQQLAQQQQELAAQQARWNAALETAMRNRNSVFPYGRVIQKISEGLLVSEGGTEDVDRPTILVKDYAGYDSAAADDWINFRTLFQVGLFSYSTVNNSENTIHAYTCSTNAAVEYYLER